MFRKAETCECARYPIIHHPARPYLWEEFPYLFLFQALQVAAPQVAQQWAVVAAEGPQVRHGAHVRVPRARQHHQHVARVAARRVVRLVRFTPHAQTAVAVAVAVAVVAGAAAVTAPPVPLVLRAGRLVPLLHQICDSLGKDGPRLGQAALLDGVLRLGQQRVGRHAVRGEARTDAFLQVAEDGHGGHRRLLLGGAVGAAFPDRGGGRRRVPVDGPRQELEQAVVGIRIGPRARRAALAGHVVVHLGVEREVDLTRLDVEVRQVQRHLAGEVAGAVPCDDLLADVDELDVCDSGVVLRVLDRFVHVFE